MLHVSKIHVIAIPMSFVYCSIGSRALIRDPGKKMIILLLRFVADLEKSKLH